MQQPADDTQQLDKIGKKQRCPYKMNSFINFYSNFKITIVYNTRILYVQLGCIKVVLSLQIHIGRYLE